MAQGSAPRRFAIGFNVVLQVLLAGALAVFLNLGIQRWHPPRMDLSRSDYYKLSGKTTELLKSLREAVEVIVFFQPDSRDPVTQKVFDDVQNLLAEYANASKQVKVRYVDPDRDPVNAEKLAKEYGVRVPNVVVFVHKGRNKFVQVSDLVEFDRMSPYGGGGGKIRAFKGEQQFTSAIQNVLEEKQAKICFLEGHGEGSFDDFDPRTGYSKISTLIRRDNLQIEKLNLATAQSVPKDCDVLVVCGPQKPFADFELKALADFLAANGRMLVLLDGFRYDTGIEKLLAEHGVKAGNDVLLIRIRDRLGGEALLTTVPCGDYGTHPVTDSLRQEEITTLFPVARSVDAVSSSDPIRRVTVLLRSVAGSWAETDVAKLQRDQKAQLDARDRKGPVPAGVAVEPSTAGDMEREGMRLAVFGSSRFVRNDALAGGNADLFMNAVNWLLKRQQLLGIAPKTPQEFSLVLDAFQRRGIFLTMVVGIPAAVAVIGFVVWIRRRK
ncbi:MAG: GldG family protein [Verrucomicrobiae bacterium]|nr:GldG family protein [Verrucomicrobiae bacterium]